jgi:dephospho-CoA kinase
VAPRLCTVGLTGGLASGKSTVAVLLEAKGALVLDADRVVRSLYRPGEAGARAVARLFGASALGADGAVDRNALGELVLAERDARARLEEVIHPLVRVRVAAWFEELAAMEVPPPLAVVEAALLVETGTYRAYDLLAVVWCQSEQQLERALLRGMSRDRARALLAAQLPLDRKRALADVVVDNSGGRSALDAEVERAWRGMLERCADRRRAGGGGV